VRTDLRLPLFFLFLILPLLAVTPLSAQSLTMVSGNGQVVIEQFLSQLPVVVQAKDASGNPLPGLAINWALTQGVGTLHNPVTTTDANGMASCGFLATTLIQNQSFDSEVITASSSVGSVSFFITTVIARLPGGGNAAPPLVTLVTPAFENRNFSAAQGSTVTAGVVVQVASESGIQQGQAIPNVGVRIINNEDPTQPSPATCTAPTGVALTDSKGFATCDLLITGAAGTTTQLTAIVGEIQQTAIFNLTITPGISCTYSLSAGSQSFGAAGGASSVNVIASQGCGWSASSNASFITINSGNTGSGNGPVGFTVAANTGGARSGTMTIAGQTFTVNQSAVNPGALTVTSGTVLPPGTTGASYSATLMAAGGQPPYNWAISGSLPPGLTFNPATATFSGVAGTAGTYGFTATVTDNLGAHASQNFSITISSAVSGFNITNVSFASGVVGQAYQQPLTTTGGCTTPFSPQPVFSVSGGSLPTGLIVQTNADFSRSITGTPTTAGTFNFTLTATDACTKSVSAAFAITITSTATTLQMLVNPGSATFTVATGGVSSPTDQTIALTSTSGTLTYTVTAATTSGGNWLILRNTGSGSTPSSITIGAANFSSLGAGTYHGTVTITSQASNSPVTVPVSLVVVGVTTTLVANPNVFVFTQQISSSSSVVRRTMIVTSDPTTSFTAAVSTTSGGNWLSVTPAQGNTPTSLLVAVDSGGLAVGTYSGSITLTPVGGAPLTLSVTLNVINATTLSSNPGTLNFAFQQGGNLPGSQLLTIGSSGAPVNVSIAAVTQTGGNWLQVDRVNGTAPLIVTVSISPAGLGPGAYTGAVYVVAGDPSIAPLPIQVNLTVSQTAPNIVSITNGASFAPGPAAPGEIVTLFGGFMGPSTLTKFQLTPAGKVATLLAGTQVFFDGFEAPIAYTSANQVSVFVPYEIAGQASTQVQVRYLGVVSNVVTLRLIDSSPGIFVLDSTGQGAILNQDFSVNSVQNGAAPDTIVSIFATGEGQTDPPGVDGSIAGNVPPKPKLNVTVQIDGLPATVFYAGGAPTLPAGVLQVNARVPTGVRRGVSVPISITVGTSSSQPGVTLAIKP
jgi:uncharacterized protein (TIGR03437 family)